MEMVCYLFAKQKAQPIYLILLRCFTISTAGFPIQTDIFLFLMVKLFPELLGKNSLKQLFAKKFRTASNGLFSSPFLAALLPFFTRKETIAKRFLTKLHKNLAVEVLSSDNSENLLFDALTDLCVEISVRLETSIFANHERARLDMKK